MQPRLLHVYIATAPRPNAAPSLVFVDGAARVLDQIPCDRLPPGPAVSPSTQASAHSRLTFRAAVYALWHARRLGFRRIAVHSDDPAAVAQINGERRVDPDAIGLYLEARALMHLYKSATVDVGECLLLVLERRAPSPPAACVMPVSS
ncbi:MAG: reverse transcriptase-like protein [bacterium]